MNVQPTDINSLERRCHRRYQVKSETFAFSGEYTGTLVDISRGGFSIQCAVLEQGPAFSSHINIFDAQSLFYLSNIPFSVVGEMQPIPASVFSRLMIKRFSVQFGSLTSEQRAQVERFIAEHTVVDS